jgi:hypothetical protein
VAGQLAALLALGLAVSPAALGQDASPAASPNAGMSEGEQMVRTLDPSALPEGMRVPATVTHVTNYGVHEWYQNLTAGEATRAQEYGIQFNQVDANLDLPASLAAAEETIQQVDVLNFTPVQEAPSAATIERLAAETGKPISSRSTTTPPASRSASGPASTPATTSTARPASSTSACRRCRRPSTAPTASPPACSRSCRTPRLCSGSTARG